jgi:hypothetical protein
MRPAACSEISLGLGEPLFATAPEAAGWLLIEQAGPWGGKALVESRLDGELGEELERRAKAAGVKALLVKPPGRTAAAGRRCFLGCSSQGRSFLEEIELRSPTDLLDVDLESLARGKRPELGREVGRPLYLVCTNSRRDACCARLGRPLAASLAERYEGRVLECSHLGGHRFAPNLVVLPQGLVLGRAGVSAAAEAEHGRIELESFRGRSSFVPAVQAADWFVRQAEGLRGIDDLALERHDGEEVAFRADDRRWRVRLTSAETDPPRPYSCGDRKLDRPVAWSLVELERLGGRGAIERRSPGHRAG